MVKYHPIVNKWRKKNQNHEAFKLVHQLTVSNVFEVTIDSSYDDETAQAILYAMAANPSVQTFAFNINEEYVKMNEALEEIISKKPLQNLILGYTMGSVEHVEHIASLFENVSALQIMAVDNDSLNSLLHGFFDGKIHTLTLSSHDLEAEFVISPGNLLRFAKLKVLNVNLKLNPLNIEEIFGNVSETNCSWQALSFDHVSDEISSNNLAKIHNVKSLVFLRINNSKIEDMGLFIESLKCLPGLGNLFLENCDLNTEEIIQLLSCIKAMKIKDLDLSFNNGEEAAYDVLTEILADENNFVGCQFLYFKQNNQKDISIQCVQRLKDVLSLRGIESNLGR
eukprot:TRINITY_DN3330_c3_g3_i1.p1 TRINITY_DN3330_c3_g3~~TRINITY_DN3330_c3_g3_i1.p1  ORF type:complete len:338 (+),score=120.23 TRINITY_DN3330_c3_g3_i1:38-1051(+)